MMMMMTTTTTKQYIKSNNNNCKKHIVFRDKNTVNIIEVTVSHDINIAVKERDKRLKYQDLDQDRYREDVERSIQFNSIHLISFSIKKNYNIQTWYI